MKWTTFNSYLHFRHNTDCYPDGGLGLLPLIKENYIPPVRFACANTSHPIGEIPYVILFSGEISSAPIDFENIYKEPLGFHLVLSTSSRCSICSQEYKGSIYSSAFVAFMVVEGIGPSVYVFPPKDTYNVSTFVAEENRKLYLNIPLEREELIADTKALRAFEVSVNKLLTTVHYPYGGNLDVIDGERHANLYDLFPRVTSYLYLTNLFDAYLMTLCKFMDPRFDTSLKDKHRHIRSFLSDRGIDYPELGRAKSHYVQEFWTVRNEFAHGLFKTGMYPDTSKFEIEKFIAILLNVAYYVEYQLKQTNTALVEGDFSLDRFLFIKNLGRR